MNFVSKINRIRLTYRKLLGSTLHLYDVIQSRVQIQTLNYNILSLSLLFSPSGFPVEYFRSLSTPKHETLLYIHLKICLFQFSSSVSVLSPEDIPEEMFSVLLT